MVPVSDLPKGGLRLLTTDALVTLPVGLPIRLLITSADVIHSWTIPAFGVKMDAIPGRINQVDTLLFTIGTYYGQCSELCGANHAFMPIMVRVISPAEYQIACLKLIHGNVQ